MEIRPRLHHSAEKAKKLNDTSVDKTESKPNYTLWLLLIGLIIIILLLILIIILLKRRKKDDETEAEKTDSAPKD